MGALDEARPLQRSINCGRRVTALGERQRRAAAAREGYAERRAVLRNTKST